jgi:leader peptidase (prepilin peptidase) / N-methyltransferase
MINMNETAWMVASMVLGLVVGSFINVVIHRLPRMTGVGDDASIDEDTTVANHPMTSVIWTITSPASHCPNCGHRLSILENIPLLSFCVLRGMCSACNKRIPARYPIVELLGAAMAVSCIIALGPTQQGFTAMVFAGFAITIAFIDLDHLMIPDPLSRPLLWCGLMVNAFGVFTPPGDAIFGAVAGYSTLWIVNSIATPLLGRAAIGQGDFKLFAAIGAWLGWQALAPTLLIASSTGVVIGYTSIWTGRMNKGRPICFAPFLLIGALVIMLSDGRLMMWLSEVLSP